MRTTISNHSYVFNRFKHYAHIAFLSGASTAFLCHSGVAQQSPDPALSSDDGNGKSFTYNYTPKQNVNSNTVSLTGYHAVSASSGPSYKFDITKFVIAVLPVNSVQYSDNSASQMNQSAVAIHEEATTLSNNANQTRAQARQADTRWQAVALCKKADSLDALSMNKSLEAVNCFIKADESQYKANEQKIATWQKQTATTTDLLTSAQLNTQEAAYYYNLAMASIQESHSYERPYIKQSMLESAQKNLETALLKQQAAENIYISNEPGKKLGIAKEIDSILSTPEETASNNTPASFDNVVFCVRVGSYSGIVPVSKANKLLIISGLGINIHKEENGVSTLTIGQYNNSSSTCAYMLSEELAEDGYGESTVVTYNKNTHTQPDTRWVIANK